MARQDPLGNFRFRVEIDGIVSASFSELAIGATTIDVIDYREGTDALHVRKLVGQSRFGNVTLVRGITDSLEIAMWQRAVVQGGAASQRRNVRIVILDDSGADEASFSIINALPVRYQPGPLNAKGNDVFIEILELANEGIERGV